MPSSPPDWNPDWIVPAWPAPAHVRAVFTTRAGGVSEGEGFASLNLGLVPGDAPAAVQTNRARVASALGATPGAAQELRNMIGRDGAVGLIIGLACGIGGKQA